MPSIKQPKNGLYTVGDFMTKKEELHVVKPTTTVDEGNSCAIFLFVNPFDVSII